MDSRFDIFIGFLFLYYLHYSSCYTTQAVPGKPLSSAGLGQQLGSIGPFPNPNINNFALLPIFVSDNYMAMAFLSRGQAYRPDINTTQDYCNINLQYNRGLWVWTTPCEPISIEDTCNAAVSSNGELQIVNGGAKVLWSSDTAGEGVKYLDLTGSGELELLNGNNDTVWKSSDHVIKSAIDFCNVSTTDSSPSSPPASSAPMLPPNSSSSSFSSSAAPGVVAGGRGESPELGHAPHSSASALSIATRAILLFSAACAELLPLLLLS